MKRKRGTAATVSLFYEGVLPYSYSSTSLIQDWVAVAHDVCMVYQDLVRLVPFLWMQGSDHLANLFVCRRSSRSRPRQSCQKGHENSGTSRG